MKKITIKLYQAKPDVAHHNLWFTYQSPGFIGIFRIAYTPPTKKNKSEILTGIYLMEVLSQSSPVKNCTDAMLDVERRAYNILTSLLLTPNVPMES